MDAGATTVTVDDALVTAANDLGVAGYGPYLQDLLNGGYPLAAAILQTQTKQALDTIHQLALSVKTAQTTGQVDAVAPLQSQVQFWLGRLATLNRTANAADQPAPLLVAMQNFSDDAIATARAAGVAVDDVTKQLGNVLKALPLIVWLVVAALIVFYAAPFLKRKG